MGGAASPPWSGLLVAAPASASGKTVLTMGLLRALTRQGLAVAPAKVGPDYIDPGYHARAAGRPCVTLDSWAMPADSLHRIVREQDAAFMLAEGVMGLFDGAMDGGRRRPGIPAPGSTADLARRTGWPILLVVDAKGQGESIGALLHGFSTFDPAFRPAGILFNRVGGARHRAVLYRAAAALNLPVIGAIPRDRSLGLDSRHLGLVQAGERADLEARLDASADLLARHADLAALVALATATVTPGAAPGGTPDTPPGGWSWPLPGRRIAMARDAAFGFVYPHMLSAWRAGGAAIATFSPLADEAPPADADAIFLPGGYPELYGGTLAAAGTFLAGLRAAAARGAVIHGECGGFMVLGDSLTDAAGRSFPMAGLLPLHTSLARPARRLGYRQAEGLAGWLAGTSWRGHEFHDGRIVHHGPAPPLFRLRDAAGADCGPAGLAVGSVTGSFFHMIDRHD